MKLTHRFAALGALFGLATIVGLPSDSASAQLYTPLGTAGEMKVQISSEVHTATTPTSGPFDLLLDIYREEVIIVNNAPIVLANHVLTRQAVEYSGHRIDMALAGAARSFADFSQGTPWYLHCSAEQQFELHFQIHEATPFTMDLFHGLDNPFAFDPDGNPIPPVADPGQWSTPTAILDIITPDGLIEWDPDAGHAGIKPWHMLGSNLFQFSSLFAPFPSTEMTTWTGMIHPGTYTVTFDFVASAGEDQKSAQIFPTIIIPEPAVAGLVLPAVLLLARRRRRHR